MKLVDYSDSEGSDSDNEEQDNSSPIPSSPPPAPKPHHATLPKRPAKRQIVVDLPKPSRATEDEPAPKRVKTEGSNGSGLFAMLPAPKRTKPATSNAVAKVDGEKDDEQIQNGATISDEQPAVITVPAPTPPKAFVPRSAQAKKAKPVTKGAENPHPSISLFPLGPDLVSKPQMTFTPPNPATYEPLIAQSISQPEAEGEEFEPLVSDTTAPPPTTSSSTLSTADLDSFAAHILEGRHRKNRTIQIMDYNAAEIYAQNAADKASGALQEQIAPVRAIGSGRHQLTQLLNNVQDQRESLEEQFAKNRKIKKESAAKYGW